MKQVVLITGTSRGLGKVIYQRLKANPNLIVYGTSRVLNNKEELQLDVTNNKSIELCIEELIKNEGRIDVLVNNVGSNLIGSVEGTTIDEYMGELEGNYLGSIRMIQSVLPIMRQNDYGKIINISSLAGRVSLPYNSAYNGAKAALEAMSKSLYYELMNSNINISLVCPIGLKIEDEVPNLKYINSEKTWFKESFDMLNRMKEQVKPSVSKEIVAKRIETIIIKDSQRFRYNIGMESRGILLLEQILPSKLFGVIIKKNL